MDKVLFEAFPDALVVVDGDGRIVRANGIAERLFGYAAEALAGLEIEVLIPAALGVRHRDHRARYMASPHVRPMGATEQTLVGQRSDGTVFPVEIALSPLETATGRQFLASIRDISDTQRQRQALVRARYDALAARIGQLALESQSEAALLEALPALLAEALAVDAVVVLFPASNGAGVEVRASSLRSEALAEPVPSGLPLPACAVVVDDCAAGSEAAAALPIVAPAAGSAALIPLRERDRVAGALMAIHGKPHRFDHDAVHLLELAANLLAAFLRQRRAEEQLAHSQRLDAIGQLTGGIAHDFNNLLTVMSGSLQLLEAEPDSGDRGELIATALRSVGRGAELTGKLLAFARRQRLVPQATDVQALLQDLALMLGRTLGDAVRLRIESADDLPAAYADPAQLETALVNLALNARDAMPRGGEIAIAATQHLVTADRARQALPVGYYVRIQVADTGRGMAPDTLARAMEPFFTTKEAGRGSGLGLSMVYGFARQSGGDLRIDSTSGHGTRVELYLPAARGAAPVRVAAQAAGARGHGERILVVEDDDAVRGIAVAFLKAAGYRPDSVASGEQALERLRDDGRYALLFSDVMLGPGINGAALARAARSLRPGLAVLLTSGNEEQAGRLGSGFELLRKPYRREDLAGIVRRLLAQTEGGDS